MSRALFFVTLLFANAAHALVLMPMLRVPTTLTSAERLGTVRLEVDEAAAPATKTSALNPEEVAALKEASVSMKPAWQADPAACPAELMNAFTKPMIYFSLLRNPDEDPPALTWDCIRAQWPVLKGRSNEELLVALKPIKADYVDIRNL